MIGTSQLINTFSRPCFTDTTDIFKDGSGVALYGLDYDASEAGGNYDGTPTAVDFGVGGKSNYGARFNGSSSYIDAGNINLGTSNVSVSLWVHPNSSQVTYANIIDYDHSSAGGWTIQQDNTSTNSYKVSVKDGSSFNISSAFSLTANQWNHVVFTVTSAGAYSIYVDNGTPTTGTGLTGLSSSTNNTLNIGRWISGASRYWGGKLDQVRIFSKALSSSEVSTLYAETACVHTATTTDNDFPTTNVAYYKLDNSAEDEKGSYDGTESNIEYRFGRFGQALKYSGASSNVETTLANSNFTSNYSISFWVNLDNANAFQNFTGNYKSAGGYGGFTFMSRDVGSGVYRFGFIWWTGVGSNYNYVDNNDVVATSGTWAHLVATKASSTLPKLYVNGTASSLNYLNSDTDHGTTGENFTIGNTLNTNYSAGLIDQVRIFSSELSSSQVTELYNEKPETDTSNFKTVLYEGNASTNFISNVGIDLETNGGLVWLKSRDNAYNHGLYDSVRGANNLLQSNTSSLNQGVTNALNSFEKTGFFLGANENSNYLNNTSSVGWVWKGGGDAVAGTGTGVTNVSLSANTDAGFSIVKYTGGNSASDTVNHGLTDAEMIILKDLDDSSNNWRAWHKDLTSGYWLYLNLTNAEASGATDGGIRNVDANTFGFINGSTQGVEGVNSSSSNYIAYVWKSVAGYSKIGSYTGGGTSDVVVTTGFKPQFIMTKRTDNTGNWIIFDSKRSTSDTDFDNFIYPNLSDAEVPNVDAITVSDTGFTVTRDNAAPNFSGANYIYMAFK